MPIEPIAGVDELITHIYHGPLEVSPWKTFLHRLRLRTGCDISAMMLRPARAGVPSLTLWDCPFTLTPEQVRHAEQEHAQFGYLDPLTNALKASGDIYVMDDVVSRAELENSEFYQRLMKPYGIEYMMGMYFEEPNGWKCFVGLINGPDKRNFGEAEKHFIRSLRPYLESAMKMYSQIKDSELEKELYEDALDRLSIGTVILDTRGRIIKTNEVARDLLTRTAAIAIVDDSIVPTKSKPRAEFARMVEGALAWREREQGSAYVEALRVNEPDGVNLGVLVRGVPVSPWYHGVSSPSVMVYLSDSTQPQLPPEQFVGRLFGLTPSEALLATLLASGLSLAEAANRLKLSEGSVRTCSKRIYAKTGVNRQASLVRLILKSVALLAGTDLRQHNRNSTQSGKM